MKIKWNNIFWRLNSFLVFDSSVRSLVHFLFGLQLASYSNLGTLLLLLVEFINLTLAGWLLFNFFARPGTLSLVPSEEIRNDSKETDLMWQYIVLVYALRFTLYALVFPIIGQTEIELFGIKFEVINTLYVSVPVLTFNIFRLLSNRKKKNIALLSDRLSEFSIKDRASQKLLSLSDDERAELALLVFRSQKLSRLTIQNLAFTIWLSLIVALAYQVLQEFFVRL